MRTFEKTDEILQVIERLDVDPAVVTEDVARQSPVPAVLVHAPEQAR